MPPFKYFLQLWVMLIGLAWGGATWGCAICAPSAEQNSLVYRLLTADAAMLAKPIKDANTWQPLQAIKGALPQGAIAVSDSLPSAAGTQAAESVLLIFNSGMGGWVNAGAMPVERADWLRRLATMRPASVLPPTDPQWAWRVELFVKDLEHPLPLLAQTAYDEIAVAPYAVMRSLQPHLTAAGLGKWLRSDALIKRRSLYNLLLGFAGDKTTAAELEQQLLAHERAQNKSELSSMMAALMELRGVAGVEWIESNYLQNKERTDMELQAAVLALTVHGNDGVKVSRERIVQSFAGFIKSNPTRAGFVASELGNWGRWEFVSAYMALLKSGVQQAFASRYAIVLYLMRSPSQDARNALEQLRAEGFL